ncbi:LPS export ABC transporter periplasmic protein LptC [Candidatus Latescibacterota bacterium]
MMRKATTIACLLFIALLSLSSCEKEPVPLKGDPAELPDQQFEHTRIIITEGGKTSAVVEAERVDVYEDRSYTSAEDSIKIEFYNTDGDHVSTLTAQKAAVWGLYEHVDSLKATGNVVIISKERSAKMETPGLLWIASHHKVFADTVKLSTDDAVEEGIDFEASDDLRSYTMKNVTGEIQGDDLEIPER